MTEKLSEKLNGRIPAYLLTELRQLEQERDTLKEQLNKPKNKCATCGKRENICADHALWVEECDGYVEVETHLRKIIDLIGKNEIRLVRENLGLKARLAKAQELVDGVRLSESRIIYLYELEKALE